MARRLNDDFMSAQPIHLIVDPISLPVELSFYPEGRKLIRNDSKRPARGVRRGSIVSKCNDLRRRFILISLTERAKPAHGFSLFSDKI